MEKPTKKPATATVAAALTYQPPVVLGRQLQPVTMAHVVALEELDNPLALMNGVPKTRHYVEALFVFSTTGRDACAKAGNRAQLAKEVNEFILSGQLAPATSADFYRAINSHYTHYFATQLAPENPPAPSGASAAASAG